MAWPLILAGAAAAGSVAVGEATRHKYEERDIDESKFQMGTAGHQMFQGQISAAQAREAPTMTAAQLNLGPQDQLRKQQMGFGRALLQRATGAAPSAAELQLQASQGRNVAAARSLAASQSGVSPAMALRSAQEAQAGMAMETQQQAAVLRAQEQAQAESAYSQFLAGARQQDIGIASEQAQLQQQAGMTNVQSALQQQQMNDQLVQFYTQQGFARDQAQMMASMEQEKLAMQQHLAGQGLDAQSAQGTLGFYGNVMGAGANMVGSGASAAGAVAASDRRVKKDVKRSKKELDALMNSLKAYKYKYKDDRLGKGERISPMAQDLEKTELGKALVSESNGTKFVDYGKGLGTMMASIARLNERIKKLEGDK